MRKRKLLLPLVTSFVCVFPISSVKRASAEEGVARAECLMELHSRRILYESHGEVRLPMASTTKIVTAATVLSLSENLKEEIKIPEQAEGIEGSSVYLRQGEVYTVEDLLYGLMLRSGNDCATALAYHFSGGVGEFATEMNKTAERAGALNSSFKNPHGLPCKGHYTTARDLTAIACYAMQNLTFEKIVSTRYYEPMHWKNKNKMLYNFEGAIGVKTGYTKEAGRCLVSAARRGDMTLVCTVLGCSPMYERSSTLLSDAFAAYSYEPILQKEEVFAVEHEKKSLRGYVKEEFSYPLMKAEKSVLEYRTVGLIVPKKTENGEEIIGQLEIYLAKRLLFSTNLYKL